jgi:hypothetical protein
MPKKIQNYGKAHLISVPLPTHGLSYTVISHESVIDMSTTALINAGFTIVEEEYRATADGQIAQGIYRLNYMGDPDLSMMFAWTNSYNKQVRFKCGVGAYVNKTGTVMVCGDIGSWARKHTGTADTETQDTIEDQVSNAYMYYNQLVSDKASMETITMNKRKQAQMLGILFAEYQILTTEQASIIRSQMDRPTHVFTDSNSLWAFYNYVTLSLQYSHPKTWMEDQRILHHFISEVNKFAPVNTPAPVISVPVDPLTVIPNQTNLLDQIADLEADQMDEDVRYDAAEILAETTFMNARELELQNELEADTFAMAQLAGVKAPEQIMDALMNASEIDASEVDMSKVTWVAPDVAGNFTLKEVEPIVVQEGSDFDIDLHQSEEIILEVTEDESAFVNDEVVTYTDPVGNTFETPIVIESFNDVLEVQLKEPIDNEPTVEELIWGKTDTEVVEELPATEIIETIEIIEEPKIEDEFALEDNFDLDFSEDTNEDSDSVPDFF